MKPVVKFSIFLLSLLIAVFFINQSRYLRGLGYETIPEPHTADEFDYVWQAISLQKYGLPVAWSMFNGVYSNPKYNSASRNLNGFTMSLGGKTIDLQDFKNNPRPITAVTQIDWGKGTEYMSFVMPFFDHPPLGGFIYSLGVNKNITEFNQVKPGDFRRPALVLALITAVLLYIFILQITGKPLVAALSSAIYSTVPTYIFATRGAYLENVSPPFILSHLILLIYSLKLIKDKKPILATVLIFVSGLIGSLGALSKETSVGFLLGSLIIVLITKVQRKYALTLIVGLVVPILVYIGWGMSLQKDLFIGVILGNLARGDFGSLKFLTILESLRFRDFPIDGWWVWGILSSFLVGKMVDIHKNKYVYLALPLLFGVLTIILTANSNYSWYWLSLIPFFASAGAIILGDLFENPRFLELVAFILIPFSSSFYWGYSVFHQNSSQNLNVYRGGFVVLIVSYLVNKYLVRFKYRRYVWMFVFAFVLFEISKWNLQSIQYLVAHWGNLPVPSIPEL